MKKVFIFEFIVLVYISINASLYSCSSKGSEALVIKKVLLQAEPDYYKDNTELTTIGTTEHFKIYLAETVWGNLRQTTRLVILTCDNEYLGNYKIDYFPLKLVGNKVIFDVEDKEYGYEIDFNNGIPEKIYIDGQHYYFQRKGE